MQKRHSRSHAVFVLALPIFPVRLQTSIFGASELNFRVRDGNGWTLTAINTNLLSCEQESKQRKLYLRLRALVQKKPYLETYYYVCYFVIPSALL